MIRFAAALSALVCLATFFAPNQETQRADGDGRSGTVVDRQGLALVQPTGRSRWTPLEQQGVLLPGDNVRTSAHGANGLSGVPTSRSDAARCCQPRNIGRLRSPLLANRANGSITPWTWHAEWPCFAESLSPALPNP